MKMTKHNMAKGFTLVELLVVIAIIAALAALSTPVVLKQQKKAALTTAINNSKQIYLLLFEYDQDTGAYPTGAGTTNVCFRDEFFKKGYTTSEDIFYAKGPIGTAKPDGNIGAAGTNTEAVAAGECGFKYVKGLSSASASGLPLLGAPFATKLAGESNFDFETYGGKAVVLTNDGAARSIVLAFDTSATPVALAPGGGDPDIFNSTKIGSTVGNIMAAD